MNTKKLISRYSSQILIVDEAVENGLDKGMVCRFIDSLEAIGNTIATSGSFKVTDSEYNNFKKMVAHFQKKQLPKKFEQVVNSCPSILETANVFYNV